jgi:hypothetical protein
LLFVVYTHLNPKLLSSTMFASTARHPLRLAGGRALSTTPARSNKLPALGDITHTPANSAAFKSRLQSFRQSLADQKKAASKPSSAYAATAGGTTGASGDAPKGGIVKSILYGSEKGQREEAEMEQSYSKVLARGKYVHAIEIHNVKPEAQQEYVKLVGSVYPEVAADKENNCHLVGSWKTEIGDPDTFGNYPSASFPQSCV